LQEGLQGLRDEEWYRGYRQAIEDVMSFLEGTLVDVVGQDERKMKEVDDEQAE